MPPTSPARTDINEARAGVDAGAVTLNNICLRSRLSAGAGFVIEVARHSGRDRQTPELRIDLATNKARRLLLSDGSEPAGKPLTLNFAAGARRGLVFIAA